MMQLHLLLRQSRLCLSVLYADDLEQIFRQHFGTGNLGFLWAAVAR